MNTEQIKNSLRNRGYEIDREKRIYDGNSKILGKLRKNYVEVVYREFYLPDQVEGQISLVEVLEDLKVPYTEVLDKEEMKVLCGVRKARESLKDSMVDNARRFLSLAQRVDNFKIK